MRACSMNEYGKQFTSSTTEECIEQTTISNNKGQRSRCGAPVTGPVLVVTDRSIILEALRALEASGDHDDDHDDDDHDDMEIIMEISKMGPYSINIKKEKEKIEQQQKGSLSHPSALLGLTYIQKFALDHVQHTYK